MSTLIGLSVLDSSLYIPELRPRRRESALQEMVARAHRAGVVRDPSLLMDLLSLREKLGTTGVGKGVAVPHARSLLVIEPRLVVARSRRGIDWNAPDEIPVQILILVLSPADLSDDLHHEFLSRAVGSMRFQRNRQRLLAAEGFEEVAGLLREVTP
jgi:mannitol/fructose-specific phosphotransferase system IIA component (Ntr-type)